MYMHNHMHMYMREAIVLDNWQLAELPQSEFDPTGVASVWVRSHRSCLSLSSIPAWSTKIYRFLCGFIWDSLCQTIKIKPTNMYIASARAQFKINTGVEIDTCAFQAGCQLSSAASGMSLKLCFWHNFSGMKRSCWTTGSWPSCLSLEVVSSISAGSTITYRFLCGFICPSLCQSIKIKPTNVYIYIYICVMVDHKTY